MRVPRSCAYLRRILWRRIAVDARFVALPGIALRGMGQAFRSETIMSRARFCSAVLFLLFATALLAPSAHALTSYCVGNVAEFALAVDRAESDNDDSRINVRSGSYHLVNDLYYYAPAPGSRIREGFLIIEGGYGLHCSTRTNDARSTVFTGDGHQTLRLNPTSGSVWLRSLSFDGVSTAIFAPSLGDACPVPGLVFDATRVRMDNGMMRFISKCHDVTLRDSLLVNGYANDFHYTYDTALDVDLRLEDDVADPATLTMINVTVAEGYTNLMSCCDRSGIAYLYNSIFRRDGVDLRAAGVNVYARNNRYDQITFVDASLVIGSSNNTTADPDLDLHYRPNSGSPMVNSGTSNVPNGLSLMDLYAGTRVVGAAVDRGALEFGGR